MNRCTQLPTRTRAHQRRKDLGGAFSAFRAEPGDGREPEVRADLAAGIDLPAYLHSVDPVPAQLRAALVRDLD
jgi:hypothetical protein